MIYPVQMFSAKCDNCDETWSNYDGICAYPDNDQMEEQLMNSEWERVDGKHYCPDCYFMDDNDEIQIRKKIHP